MLSWQHLAAQHGMVMFDEDWNPAFNSEAGLAGVEQIPDLHHMPTLFAGHGWPENRAAFLGTCHKQAGKIQPLKVCGLTNHKL